jgi:hypothetical protein
MLPVAGDELDMLLPPGWKTQLLPDQEAVPTQFHAMEASGTG